MAPQFLNSARDGGELSASRPGLFTPAERAPGTRWIVKPEWSERCCASYNIWNSFRFKIMYYYYIIVHRFRGQRRLSKNVLTLAEFFLLFGL
jgi:hypothetical protein